MTKLWMPENGIPQAALRGHRTAPLDVVPKVASGSGLQGSEIPLAEALGHEPRKLGEDPASSGDAQSNDGG